MNKIILVAHGEGGKGTFSITKAKTITPASTDLTFVKAKEYMTSSKAWPEFSSTSYGEFGPLSDDDCKDLFNKIPAGNGVVSTGLRRGGDMAGIPIYVLRGANDMSRDQLTKYITDNNISSLILLACRGL